MDTRFADQRWDYVGSVSVGGCTVCREDSFWAKGIRRVTVFGSANRFGRIPPDEVHYEYQGRRYESLEWAVAAYYGDRAAAMHSTELVSA
jgi:hypothetical protein